MAESSNSDWTVIDLTVTRSCESEPKEESDKVQAHLTHVTSSTSLPTLWVLLLPLGQPII